MFWVLKNQEEQDDSLLPLLKEREKIQHSGMINARKKKKQGPGLCDGHKGGPREEVT